MKSDDLNPFTISNINPLSMSDHVQEISSDQINDPADPMRSALDRDGLFDLAENIKQNGLINPITVRPVDGRYEVVAGHRRLSACKIAGIIRIPCVVRELDDNKAFEIMAAENLERQDVDPVDEATFITNFIAKTGKSVDEVAKALKRSTGYVQTRLEVGSMPDYMKEYIKAGVLKLGVALALIKIDNESTRRVWVDLAVRDGASVAQAEYWLYDYERQKLPGGTISDTPPSDYVPGAPQAVMFTCAIDGQKYDARMFKTLMVYEGNLEYFSAFVSAFNGPPVESELGSGG